MDPITGATAIFGLNIIRIVASNWYARKQAKERLEFDLANSEANRQLQREENAKNRAVQRELAFLNFANAEENRRLQREIQQRNENLQRELQANSQNFQFAMAERNAELQRELCYVNHQYRVAEAQYNFENTVKKILFEDFIKHWPGQVPAYVLERNLQTNANISSLGIFLYRNSSGQDSALDKSWNSYVYPVIENQLEIFCNKFACPPYNANNIVYYHDSFRRDVHGGAIVHMLQYAFASLPVIVLECNPLPDEVSLAVTSWDLGSTLSPAPKHFVSTLSYEDFGGIKKCLADQSSAKRLAHAVALQFKLMIGFLFDTYNLINFAKMPVFPLLATDEYEEYLNSREYKKYLATRQSADEVPPSTSTPLADPESEFKILDMYKQLYDKVLKFKSISEDRFTPELRLAYAESLVRYVGEDDSEDKKVLRDMLEDSVRSWVGRRSEMKAEEWLRTLHEGGSVSGKQLVPMDYCHRGDCDFLCELSALLDKCDTEGNELAKLLALVCEDLRPLRKYLKDPESFKVEDEPIIIEPEPEPDLNSLRAVYEDKQVGDRFEFGRYPQGSNGEEKPITFRVLRRDTDSLLVIAEMGLDAKPYNKDFVSITWSDCTLRRWLNDEFYKKAFNKQEQSLIKEATLANNVGPSTDDKVFLLSVDEARSLFANDNDRICKPTGYAVKNGAFTNSFGNAWWWLRSRGNGDNGAAFVSFNGCIYYIGSNVSNFIASIRPAFQLAI